MVLFFVRTTDQIRTQCNEKHLNFNQMRLSVLAVLLFICCASVTARENSTVSPALSPITIPSNGTSTAPVPERSCYTNLTEIEDLVKVKDPFVVETYTLCPNTTYQMGTYDTDSPNLVNGYQPITTRSNSIYQCGEDGKASNNCVITGGEFHIFHDFRAHNKENKVNIVLKGITFEDANSHCIVAAAPGDIKFMDCIFRNHQNLGVLALLYSHVETTRRLKTIMLMAIETNQIDRMTRFITNFNDPLALENYKSYPEYDARSHKRHLQAGDIITVQTVTIEGCLFENNLHGPVGEQTYDGMIYLAGPNNTLIVKNTIFRNNNFTTPSDGDNGFAISSIPGAKLNISDVCFIDNLFIGSGVVVVKGTKEDISSASVYGTTDPQLKCPYASINSETCLQYESSTCTALHSANVYDTDDSIAVGGRTSGCGPINSIIFLGMLMFSGVIII